VKLKNKQLYVLGGEELVFSTRRCRHTLRSDNKFNTGIAWRHDTCSWC